MSATSSSSPPLRCADRLAGALSDGEWHPSEDVKCALAACGWSERSVKRAAQELAVEVERRGFPSVTFWRLRAESGQTAEPAQQSRSFDIDEAAARWRCSREWAREFIFGAGGFLELGFVAREDDGRVVVTDRGRAIAHAMRWLPEVSA